MRYFSLKARVLRLTLHFGLDVEKFAYWKQVHSKPIATNLSSEILAHEVGSSATGTEEKKYISRKKGKGGRSGCPEVARKLKQKLNFCHKSQNSALTPERNL